MAGAFFVSKATAVYQTSTTVILGPSADQIFSTDTALTQVSSSDGFLAAVISAGKLSYSPAELRDRVRVEKVTETSMAIITVTDRDSAAAKKICDLVAANFVKKAKSLEMASRRSLSKQSEEISKQIENVDDLIAEISELTGPEAEQAVRVDLVQPRQTLLNQKLGLMAQKQQLLIELDKTALTQILAPAVKPDAPQTNIPRNVALAGLASLIAGIGLSLAAGPGGTKELL